MCFPFLVQGSLLGSQTKDRGWPGHTFLQMEVIRMYLCFPSQIAAMLKYHVLDCRRCKISPSAVG